MTEAESGTDDMKKLTTDGHSADGHYRVESKGETGYLARLKSTGRWFGQLPNKFASQFTSVAPKHFASYVKPYTSWAEFGRGLAVPFIGALHIVLGIIKMLAGTLHFFGKLLSESVLMTMNHLINGEFEAAANSFFKPLSGKYFADGLLEFASGVRDVVSLPLALVVQPLFRSAVTLFSMLPAADQVNDNELNEEERKEAELGPGADLAHHRPKAKIVRLYHRDMTQQPASDADADNSQASRLTAKPTVALGQRNPSPSFRR